MKQIAAILLSLSLLGCSQRDKTITLGTALAPKPKGTLFIMGGGSRPDAMMEEMVEMAGLKSSGYALVFTQTSSEPDTSFHYLSRQLQLFTERPIIMMNDSVFSASKRDSIRNAALIFIVGGDQNRFMEKVGIAEREQIRMAYEKGAVIGGTSAGAALMSKIMITGDQVLEPEYEPTYSWLRYGNGIYAEGLGLLDSLIVDQHFVARSRYNRLLSALADTHYPCAVGIDESTALVVGPNYCTVSGENQVIRMNRPKHFSKLGDRIGLQSMQIDIYLKGDTFTLPKQ